MPTFPLFRPASCAQTFADPPLRRLASRLAAIFRGRQAITQLADYDDHLLNDVGLNRADVTSAFERPLTSDPSAHLASVVERRMRGHR